MGAACFLGPISGGACWELTSSDGEERVAKKETGRQRHKDDTEAALSLIVEHVESGPHFSFFFWVRI